MNKEADKWHKRGVVMSLISVVIIISAAVFEFSRLPSSWYVVTRHSDRPLQVIEGINGLDREISELQKEIDFRMNELRRAEVRAGRKAVECESGRDDDAKPVQGKKLEELKELAPQWKEAAAAASEAVRRHTSN